MPVKVRVWLMALTLALLATSIQAQSPPGKQDDGKGKRIVYVVQHGSAKNLATMLSKHFKGDIDVQAGPDAGPNVLLINASAASYDEVLATLAKLDRKLQSVTIEIFVIELPPKQAGAVEEKDLSGAAEKVAEKVEALQKKGVFGSVKRYQTTALDNQQLKLLNGETKAIITGVVMRGNGQVSYTIIYKNVGTNIVLTPKLADKSVALDLNFEDVRAFQPEDGVPLGMNEKGQPILATDFAMTKLNTTMNVDPGQAVLLNGIETKSKSGTARTMVIVSVRTIQ
jgi:type II secretory pathway component GspD/PulD (secretin)